MGYYNKKIKGKNIFRYCSIKKSIKESLKQVKLHKDGKIKLQTWDEYITNKNKKG